MKKYLALILAALMLLGLFAGCTKGGSSGSTATPAADNTPAAGSNASTSTDAAEQSESPDTENPASAYPIVTDGSITLTMMIATPSSAAPYTSDVLDGTNYVWPEWMRRTGINLELYQIVDSNYSEQMNLTIASSDIPDIMRASGYSGGINQAYEDEVFARLNEYEDLMPNYMKWVNLTDANRKAAYTFEGNLMAFSQVRTRNSPSTIGYAVREDWINDLGLAMPKTIRDWHDMLVSFKQNKTGGSGPLELSAWGVPFSSFFIGAYDCNYGWGGDAPFVCINDKIVYCPIQDGFRSYLELMNSWWNEGLIEESYVTHFAQQNVDTARLGLNQVGAAQLSISNVGSFYAETGVAEESCYFRLAELPTLDGAPLHVTNKGNDAQAAQLGAEGWCIGYDSDKKEPAIRFLDYLYSEEGSLLTNYGIEGETFHYEDGKPVQDDLILHNPTMNVTTAQEVYLIHTGFVFDVDREFGAFNDEAQRAGEIWNTSGDYNLSAALSYTTEESNRRSALAGDLSTYCSEKINAFIMGVTELNDANWNEFVSTLQSIGCEEYTQITQTAYDRWLAQ